MQRWRIIGYIVFIALIMRLSLIFAIPAIAPAMRLHMKYNLPIDIKEPVAVLNDLSWFTILNNRVKLIPFQDDEWVYDQLAVNALEGKGFSVDKGWYTVPPGKPAAYWNFLYPFFLAAIYFIFGHHQIPVFIFQAILNSIAIGILYLLAFNVFNKESISILSSLIATFHPILLFLPSLMMTEAIFVPLIIITFYLYYIAQDSGELKCYVLCGVFFALASLTREVIFPFLPILVINEFIMLKKSISKSKAIIKSGVMLAAIFITISPWTIRNYVVFKRFLPLSTKLGITLWMYNNPSQEIGWDISCKGKIMYEFPDSMNEIDRDRFYLLLALNYMKNNPGRVIANLPWKFLRSVNPSLGTAKNRLARIFTAAYVTPMMLFSLLGLFIQRNKFRRLSILYLLLFYWLIIMIGSAPGPRYRLGIEWIIIAFAAAGSICSYEMFKRKSACYSKKES